MCYRPNQLAQRHIAEAKKTMAQYFIQLEDPDLAYLVQSSPQFGTYIRDMLWAQAYAVASPARIHHVLSAALFSIVGVGERLRTISCFAGETGVVTSFGVRPIAELAGGIHELLTTEGEWVKAPIRSFGRQRLMRVRLSRNKVEKVIYATPEHRWLLRTHSSGGTRYWGKRPAEVTTAELKPGDRLAWSFPLRPEGIVVDHEGAARGFVFGDGTVSPPNRSRANFCGEKDIALLPLFQGLGRPPRTYPTMTVINGLPLKWKTCVPSLDCAPSYLYGWLAGYFAADGDVGKTGRPTLVSAVRKNREQVRTMCNLLGIGTYGVRTNMRSGYGEKPTPIYLLGIMRGDVDPSFFLIPAHRERFEAGIAHHNFIQMESTTARTCGSPVRAPSPTSAKRGDPRLDGDLVIHLRGRRNPGSYNSCSHGAGRRMSRSRAKRELSAKSLTEAMHGRTWNANRAAALVDEHPEAYKSIDQVMQDQKDLVEIQHTLHQIFNYKG
ncbi:RtcB family protein [Sphaerisporangium sp. NBC_01403]